MRNKYFILFFKLIDIKTLLKIFKNICFEFSFRLIFLVFKYVFFRLEYVILKFLRFILVIILVIY